MEERIGIKDAKEELVRINSVLTRPHILIGGLAVNQYDISRISTDIDLVVDFKTATDIIQKLYPSLTWNTTDKNNDEIRPSYEIISRANPELVIRFGPKILQRQPYEFIDWNILFTGANKFTYQNNQLDNILVPSPVYLSFTKLISYIARKDSNPSKASADLNDFCNLTNRDTWNAIDFYTIVANVNAFDYLIENLKFSKAEKEVLEKSSFYQLVNLFRSPTEEISKIPNPTDIQKQRVEKAISSGQEFLSNYKNIGAIGMDLIGFTSINMKYGSELGDRIINTIGQLIKAAGLKQHTAEVVGDTFIVYLVTENVEQLKNDAETLHKIISNYKWNDIKENLFVNAYTSFGLIKENETIHDFSKRIFDSILSQKESGEIFKEAGEKISRNDWNIEEMMSHR
jgi:GGDEF domain-containing protein